MDFDGYYL
jgi:hypothetical protein